MPCPICILPFLSGAAAFGSGASAFRAKNKSMMWLMIIVSIIFTILTIYIMVKKDDLKQECESCQLPTDDQDKKSK